MGHGALAVEFGELRPQDLAAARSLVQSDQPDRDVAGENMVLGLAAREAPAGRIIGAILIHRHPDHGYVHTLGVDPEHRDGNLSQQLIARAMTKLYHRGVHRCHLAALSPGAEFWDLVRWPAQPHGPTAEAG